MPPTITGVVIIIFIVITGYSVITSTAAIHRLPLVLTARQLGHVSCGMVVGQRRAADICVSTVDVLTVSCGNERRKRLGYK